MFPCSGIQGGDIISSEIACWLSSSLSSQGEGGKMNLSLSKYKLKKQMGEDLSSYKDMNQTDKIILKLFPPSFLS